LWPFASLLALPYPSLGASQSTKGLRCMSHVHLALVAVVAAAAAAAAAAVAAVEYATAVGQCTGVDGVH